MHKANTARPSQPLTSSGARVQKLGRLTQPNDTPKPPIDMRSSAHHLRVLCISIALLSGASVGAAPSDKSNVPLGNDEETFVFAARCANGKPYRLRSYQQTVGGVTQSYYDYLGPAGQGTVQSDADPKVMAVRVCHPLAEIINANYWE